MTQRLQSGWDAALHIIQSLRADGHQAVLAGGCVRDMLLSRTPKDYDVATNATPDRVGELFPKARRVGAKFGVMLVRKFGQDIEVATFRSDGTYSDGRHPDQVTFGTEVEDARRRDFTVNGMFYDPIDDRIIDYVDGQRDLRDRIIRTIGDPVRRLTEDHLRTLRAVRFAAALGFEIDATTLSAIRELAPQLPGISAERIWMELSLLLTHPSRAAAWCLLVSTGLCHYLAPSWAIPPGDLVGKRLESLSTAPIGEPLALAAVWADESPALVRQLADELRLSNRLTDATVWLVRHLPLAQNDAALELADLKLMMAGEHWPPLLDLLRADLLARGESTDPYTRICTRAGQIPPEAVAPPPLLTGQDLLTLGFPQGPAFGEIIRAAYRAQLNERLTTKTAAMEFARRELARLNG